MRQRYRLDRALCSILPASLRWIVWKMTSQIALSAIRLGANLMLALGHVYARADFDDLPGQRACDIDVSRRAETLLVGDLLRVTLRTMPKSRSKPMSCRAAWRTEDERLAQLLRHLPRTGLRVSAAVENVIGRQIVAGEKIDSSWVSTTEPPTD